MELWELISLLRKRVVWEIMLMPMDKEEDEDD